MSDYIVVIGEVSSKQYQPVRLHMLKHGMRPKVIRANTQIDAGPYDYYTILHALNPPQRVLDAIDKAWKKSDEEEALRVLFDFFDDFGGYDDITSDPNIMGPLLQEALGIPLERIQAIVSHEDDEPVVDSLLKGFPYTVMLWSVRTIGDGYVGYHTVTVLRDLSQEG